MEAPSEASADVSDAVSDGAELLSAFPEAAESAEADVSPVCVSSGADDACCDEDVPAVPAAGGQRAQQQTEEKAERKDSGFFLHNLLEFSFWIFLKPVNLLLIFFNHFPASFPMLTGMSAGCFLLQIVAGLFLRSQSCNNCTK